MSLPEYVRHLNTNLKSFRWCRLFNCLKLFRVPCQLFTSFCRLIHNDIDKKIKTISNNDNAAQSCGRRPFENAMSNPRYIGPYLPNATLLSWTRRKKIIGFSIDFYSKRERVPFHLFSPLFGWFWCWCDSHQLHQPPVKRAFLFLPHK